MSLTSELFDLTIFDHADLFANVGAPWEAVGERLLDYLKANATTQRVCGEVHPTAIIEGDVLIGHGTVIGTGAIVRGPTIIGANCFIGPSLVRSALVGDGCVIGYACEVARSVLLNGVKLAHLSYVGDTIIGNRVNVGGGTFFANVKLNGSEVLVTVGKQRCPTGVTRLGALIGDDCKIGAGCVLNPGAVLGKGCIVWPHTDLRGWYPARCAVKVIQTQQVKEEGNE